MYRLSLILVSGSLLVACQDSLAPAGRQPTARDEATIRSLLDDPVLALTMNTLGDQAAGTRLRDGLAGLRRITSSEAIAALRGDLGAARESGDPADSLGLEVIALTLDRMDDAITASRTATGP